MIKYSLDGFRIRNTQTTGIFFQCNITHVFNNVAAFIVVAYFLKIFPNKQKKIFFFTGNAVFMCEACFVYRCVTDIIGAENQLNSPHIHLYILCMIGSSNGKLIVQLHITYNQRFESLN